MSTIIPDGIASTSSRTLAQLLQHLVQAAAAGGVTADRRAIADGVAPFADRFCTKPVELRTTTLPGDQREVSFRFVDEDARGEVWMLAHRWFELVGAPSTFMGAVHRELALRAEGIDVDVRTGFRKVWAFLSAGYRAERFVALDGAPPGLARVASVLERHGVQHLSIVGTDHHSATCNLYPMLAPGWASRERVRALAQDLGLPPMEEAWLEGIERSVAANFTFSWPSDEVLRLAFYRPAMTLDEVPDDPVLRRFARECPVVADRRGYIPSVAFSRGGHYRKVEVDYDGGIIGVLGRCAQVPVES